MRKKRYERGVPRIPRARECAHTAVLFVLLFLPSPPLSQKLQTGAAPTLLRASLVLISTNALSLPGMSCQWSKTSSMSPESKTIYCLLALAADAAALAENRRPLVDAQVLGYLLLYLPRPTVNAVVAGRLASCNGKLSMLSERSSRNVQFVLVRAHSLSPKTSSRRTNSYEARQSRSIRHAARI